jgi:hypothetical protein
LERDPAPKIIARLPFVERADHPAGLPVFVISRAAPDAMVKEVEMWSVRVAGWRPRAGQDLGSMADVIAVPDTAYEGAALLIAVPRGGHIEAIIDGLVRYGASVRSSTVVGSHASRYRIAGQGPVLVPEPSPGA